METTISKNGRGKLIIPDHGPEHRETRPQTLSVSIGTMMNSATRCRTQWLSPDLAGAYELSIDTTAQRDHPDGLPHLPHAIFRNLADSLNAQHRLRRALRNPRISEWMTSAVTKMNPGAGAGAQPLLARFLLEDQLKRVLQQIEGAISSLIGPRRADAATELRGERFQGESLAEPIQVIIVTTTVGGTASLTELVRLLLDYVIERHGGEAKYELVLTLPIVTTIETVASTIRKVLTHARLQELADSFAGKEHIYRPTDDITIAAQGPLYHAVHIMPEPLDGALDEHVRFVANYHRGLLEPIGKALSDKLIDFTAHCDRPGPLGQRRFLSLVGKAELRGVPHPILPFAEAVLGELCTRPGASDSSDAAEQFCRQQGFVLSNLFSALPALHLPDTSRVSEKASAAFLQNSEKRLIRKRNEHVQAAKHEFESRCTTAKNEFLARARTIAASNGAEALRDYAQHTSQRLEAFRTLCFENKAVGISGVSPHVAALSERAEAIRTREEALARQALASFAPTALDPLIAVVNTVRKKADRRARYLEKARIQYARLRRKMHRPAKHSVLTSKWLEAYIQGKGKECLAAVRAISWDVTDAAKFAEKLDSTVKRHTEVFRPLEEIDEALKVAPERAEVILERTLVAAEPRVRLDPLWDAREHASRLLFTTMPRHHALAAVLDRTGREVVPAASADMATTWQFIAIDCGVEVGALKATKEAWTAFISHLDPDYPPFVSKSYVPVTRLSMPSSDEWLACLALVAHRCLSNAVTRTQKGLYFRGVFLGADYGEATRQIQKREDRNPHLPSFEEISEATESLLSGNQGPSEVVASLQTIEASLKRRLKRLDGKTDRRSVTERVHHDEELAVTEALIAVYNRFAEDAEADEEDWRGGELEDG